MPRMRLSRAPRAVIALFTAVLLLLCQAAFALQVCHGNAARQDISAAGPCQTGIDEGDFGSHLPKPPETCQVAKAFAEPLKIPVLATVDLPVMAVHYDERAIARQPQYRSHAIQAACHSPPLTLLHCRFLN